MSQPLMQIRHISRQIGGLHILQDISMEIQAGEILGLIGPNGAGKTSLLNAISGQSPADSGQLLLGQQDISRWTVDQRARHGLARSFQTSRLFPELSLIDNISMAIRLHQGSAYRWWRRQHWLEHSHHAAAQILQGTPLAHKKEQLAQSLSYGEQRILDLLICLAQQPVLLLLDEPTAGLSSAEASAVVALIAAHKKECAVVLISHDIDIVMSTCQRVAVLSQGQLIACDHPQAIRDNPAAQQAYLGSTKVAA